MKLQVYAVRNRIRAAIALAALLAATGTNASSRADVIEAKLRVLEAEIAKLRREAHEAKAQAQRATTMARARKQKAAKIAATRAPAPPPVFTSFRKDLSVETEDKAYSFELGGRILVDGGASTIPETGLNGIVNVRQARLQIEGRAAKIWAYKFAYDFANTSSAGGALGGIRDAYIVLNHPDLRVPIVNSPVALIVGNQWEPNGLEATTTTLFIDFVERAPVSGIFGPSRHIGASLVTHSSNWTFKGSVFSTSPEDRSFTPAAAVASPYWVNPKAGWVSTGGGQYFNVVGRGTYAPIIEPDKLIHLGFSGRYYQPNSATGANDNGTLLLGSRVVEGSSVLKETLLGTPDLSCGSVSLAGAAPASGRCVRDAFFYGAEFVGSYGPFSLQAEYMGGRYDRRDNALALARVAGNYAPGGNSLNFDGFYVYGTWYLTGESRSSAYTLLGSPNNPATFGKIKILNPFSAGGWGAWELAARFSSINLNSGPYQGTTFANLIVLAPNNAIRSYVSNSSINGGRQQEVTLGLNWYPDTGIRFMANWTHVVSLNAPWDRPYLNGAHPDIFTVRTQVSW